MHLTQLINKQTERNERMKTNFKRFLLSHLLHLISAFAHFNKVNHFFIYWNQLTCWHLLFYVLLLLLPIAHAFAHIVYSYDQLLHALSFSFFTFEFFSVLCYCDLHCCCLFTICLGSCLHIKSIENVRKLNRKRIVFQVWIHTADRKTPKVWTIERNRKTTSLFN